MYKILIVDNFSIVRSGLNQLLEDEFEDVERSDAKSADEVLAQLEAKSPFDLVIMSENLEDINTEKLVKKVSQINNTGHILIFADHFNYPQSLSYFVHGATGYITKQAEKKDIVTAIRSQLNDESYMGTEMIEAIIKEKMSSLKGGGSAFNDNGKKSSLSSPDLVLSKRQREIVNYLILGESTTNIARILNLKLSTVSTHKSKIYEKLNVSNIMALKDIMTQKNK